MWQVKEMVRTEELKGMVGRVGGDARQRKVWEVLDSAAGLPPLPLKSAYSSRSPSSRQVCHPSLLPKRLINACQVQQCMGVGVWGRENVHMCWSHESSLY